MTKIFLTGATGYIGGEVLSQLVKDYPDLDITCMLRDETKQDQIRVLSQKLQFVKGDLDSTEILESCAASSDIVLHLAATGHIKSTKALVNGLCQKAGSQKGYFIQISGATLLAQEEIKNKVYGKANEKVYNDDDDGTEEVKRVTKAAYNRTVDNFILFECPESVKSALIVGPLIYGQANGPGNKRSMQVPDIAKLTLQRGGGFQIGEGQNRWANIHVRDIANLIVKLVGNALEGGSDNSIWGREGLYFAANDEDTTFSTICEAVAKSAHQQGLIASPEAKDIILAEELDKHISHGSVIVGTNARTKAFRAKKVLGWTITAPSLLETINATVAVEAKSLNHDG